MLDKSHNGVLLLAVLETEISFWVTSHAGGGSVPLPSHGELSLYR